MEFFISNDNQCGHKENIEVIIKGEIEDLKKRVSVIWRNNVNWVNWLRWKVKGLIGIGENMLTNSQ